MTDESLYGGMHQARFDKDRQAEEAVSTPRDFKPCPTCYCRPSLRTGVKARFRLNSALARLGRNGQ